MSKRIRHRGPDWSGIYQGKTAILAHERLSIVDPASGGQPLKSKDGKLILTVNGEIYNHRELRKELEGEYEFLTGSDCEVILALYRKYGVKCVEMLSGIFGFALYDEENDCYLIARDPIGVIPLYIGYDNEGHLLVASELKALEGFAAHYDQFPPGHYYYSRDKDFTRWYTRDWMKYDNVKNNPASVQELHEVASEQYPLTTQVAVTPVDTHFNETLKVENEKDQIGFRAPGFFVAFNPETGKMISLRYAGTDMIYNKKGLDFNWYRSMDNDKREYIPVTVDKKAFDWKLSEDKKSVTVTTEMVATQIMPASAMGFYRFFKCFR